MGWRGYFAARISMIKTCHNKLLYMKDKISGGNCQTNRLWIHQMVLKWYKIIFLFLIILYLNKRVSDTLTLTLTLVFGLLIRRPGYPHIGSPLCHTLIDNTVWRCWDWRSKTIYLWSVRNCPQPVVQVFLGRLTFLSFFVQSCCEKNRKVCLLDIGHCF